MKKNLTTHEFFKMFPDNDSCLDHLMETRYGQTLDCPKCGKHGKFSRIAKVPAYQCSWCAFRIHPMVGTPFEKSSTALTKWFYAMYLFTTSRHGVPAKELQRQLGVTYKTAWRMGHEIRKYMGMVDGSGGLKGHVEADETVVGGRVKGKFGRQAGNKPIVMGMHERDGKVMTQVVPNVRAASLIPIITKNVEQGSTISTDELRSYSSLAIMGFVHGKVNHSKGEYVRGKTHTNSIEGFWSRLKNSIKGTHVHVSRKHLQSYLVEFEFRHNMRATPHLMFDRLLKAF
ncbi:MAG: IS1595 family transposase [Gammaproteobacteria bacterium]